MTVPETPQEEQFERIPLDEAGKLFDPQKSRGAVEQMVHRWFKSKGKEGLQAVREKDEKGRTRHVWTTREWMRDYARNARKRGKLRVRDERDLLLAEPRWAGPVTDGDSDLEDETWMTIAQEQALEILRLTKRIRDLEKQLAERER